MKSNALVFTVLSLFMLVTAMPDSVHAARKTSAGTSGQPTQGAVSCQKKFGTCKKKCWSDLEYCENKVSPYRLPACVDDLQRCLNKCRKNRDSCRNRTGTGGIRAMKKKPRRKNTERTRKTPELRKKKP